MICSVNIGLVLVFGLMCTPLEKNSVGSFFLSVICPLFDTAPSSVRNQDQAVLNQNTERICYVYFAVTLTFTVAFHMKTKFLFV